MVKCKGKKGKNGEMEPKMKKSRKDESKKMDKSKPKNEKPQRKHHWEDSMDYE